MVRKLMTMAAGAALAIAPVAAQAAQPSVAHSSEARAGVGMEDASDLRGRNRAVFIGLILLVIFLAIVTANGDDPSNSP